MVYWTGKVRLIQKFSLEIMLRLYHFSISIKAYVQKPKSNVRSICYILTYRSKKCFICKLLLALSTKKSFNLNIEKLQPHKRTTSLKLCKYNIFFNQ